MRKLFAILLTLCMVFSFVSFAGAEDVTITFAFWDNNQEPGMQAIADAYMAARSKYRSLPGTSTGPSWKHPHRAAAKRCPMCSGCILISSSSM